MIIHKITLKNFRQFLGRHEILVDSNGPGENSIFLIIGVNGSGKTTLLSALHFAFHGENLASLDNPNRFCHEDVFQKLQDGEDTEVEVEVEFSRGDSKFALQRTLKLRRFGQDEMRLQEEVMLLNLNDGRLITPPGRWIASWFPPNLAQFFFFPGEHLEDFFEESRFTHFVDDIKSMSGLDKVELIMDSGKSVIQRLQKRISGITGDNQATLLVDAISKLGERKSKQEELLGALRDRKRIATSELKDANAFLEAKEKEIGLIAELATVRHEIDALERSSDRLEDLRMDMLRTRGWVALAAESQAVAKRRVSELKESGLLRNELPKSLLRDILDSGQCLCGQLLDEGTTHRSKLESHLMDAGSLEAPERYGLLLEAMKSGNLSLESLASSWIRLNEEESAVKTSLDVNKAREQAILSSIANDTNDLYLSAQLERRDELLVELTELDSEIQEGERIVDETSATLASKREELADAEASRGQHGILIRQMQSLERVLDSIAGDAIEMKQRIRLDLEQELNEQVQPIYMYEPVQIGIGPNFELKVTKNGAPFSESNGQKVLRALALVLVLHRISSRLALNTDFDDFPSSQAFPLVIDAGFGVLNTGFIQIATDWLLELRTQVILILLPLSASPVLEKLGSNPGVTILEISQKSLGEDETGVLLESEVTFTRFGQQDKVTRAVRLTP
jgi:DNA sulfur modification protein DndD